MTVKRIFKKTAVISFNLILSKKADRRSRRNGSSPGGGHFHPRNCKVMSEAKVAIRRQAVPGYFAHAKYGKGVKARGLGGAYCSPV